MALPEKPAKLVRVRILTSMAGDNFSYAKGDTPAIPESEAKGLVAAGFAESLDKRESAVAFSQTETRG